MCCDQSIDCGLHYELHLLVVFHNQWIVVYTSICSGWNNQSIDSDWFTLEFGPFEFFITKSMNF